MKIKSFSYWPHVHAILLAETETTDNVSVWSDLRKLLNEIVIKINLLEYSEKELGIESPNSVALLKCINTQIENFYKNAFLLKLK